MDPLPARNFSSLISGMAETAERDVEVDAAERHGWLVEEGSTVLITDHHTSRMYLVTVQEV